MRRVGVGAGAVLLLIAITCLDFVTGIEVRLLPLYFIPLSLIASRFGLVGGITASLATAVAWEIANRAAGRLYSAEWITWWNLAAMLGAFVTISAMAAAQTRHLERLHELARIDALTGAANSRVFYEVAEQEIARARRASSPLTLVYIDLDNFKTVNDTLGHAAGDEVLIATASLLRNSCRVTDVVARLGGDEFALLLPDTGADGARALLTKIQDEFRATSHSRSWPISLAAGAVCYTQPPLSVEDMVRSADGLMYEVKQSGKDSYRIRSA